MNKTRYSCSRSYFIMARKTCPLSSHHVLYFVSTCFAVFLIQHNESFIPTRCTGCKNRQPDFAAQNDMDSCLRTAFFGIQKSSVALGAGSSESDVSSTTSDSQQESPAIFFADKESGASDNNDDDKDVRSENDTTIENSKDETSAEKESPLEEGGNEAAEQTAAEQAAEQAAERAAEQAAAEEAAEQAAERAAEQAAAERAAEELRELQFQEWKEKTIESVESILKPLSEIQEGVPSERIKGAAIAATALTLLASKGVVASSAVGLSAAYVSISKSVFGDLLRTVGGITWDVTETTTKLADQLGIIPTFGEVDKRVVNKYKRRKPIKVGSEIDEGELAFIEAEGDDDLSRVLREAESVISEADAAIAKAEAEQKEKVKESIEEELKMIAEKASTQVEEIINDQSKIKAEEEITIVEEDTTTEIIELNQEKEEGAMMAEDEQIVDEAKEEVMHEDLEEENDTLFDDDQFLAAVELAQEGIEGKIIGVDDIITDYSAKAIWDAAGELASELRQDNDESYEDDIEDEDGELDFVSLVDPLTKSVKPDADSIEKSGKDYEMPDVESMQEVKWDDDLDEELIDENFVPSTSGISEDDYDFGDVDFEALGKAAREAVEAFESDLSKADEASLNQKQEWADSMIEEDQNEASDYEFKDDDINERTVVQADRSSVMDLDTTPSEVPKDWSSLKVFELKKELKKRGLKTSGRKAELVSLLERNDIESFDEVENSLTLDIGSDNVEVGLDEIDIDLEELGRQAREAVEMFQGNFDEEPTEEMLQELESEMAINGEFPQESEGGVDYSKMTVAQLKEECRKRALKVSGRKVELIERIENSLTD